jgi:molybdate transport system substrate-binding protein
VNKKSAAALIQALLFLLAIGAQGQKLLVSAASSLTDVLSALGLEAERAAGLPMQFNFGASGSLRAQIENGAPVDVFLSAAAADVDKLAGAGLLAPGTRVDLLSNSIVLVAEGTRVPVNGLDSGISELKTLLAAAKVLAIGNPDSVPAGRYAMQALIGLGLYSLVEGRTALGGTVREVLQFVQSGSAPLGIVFLTDAMSVKTGAPISVIWRFPDSSIADRIIYPIAAIAASKNQAAAARFIAFLQGADAQVAFAAAGFTKP